MSASLDAVLAACAADSLAGRASFGEIVRRLAEAGVERYHADYSRGETTYYLAGGDSRVVTLPHPAEPIATGFSASGVADAVRRSQRGEIAYPDFVRLTRAAGCVGYVVQLTGKRVHYFGRDGDLHTEWFPGAGP